MTGSPPTSHGVPVVRGPFSFAHDTASLDTGVRFYTPAVGDLLLDLWIEVDTAWNGVQARADVGTFVGGNTGLYALAAASVVLNVQLADTAATNNAGILVNAGGQRALSLFGATLAAGNRIVPARFTAANPLYVVVSQDGSAATPVAATVLADAAPSSPLIVAAGVNDQFSFSGSPGGTAAPETFTVAPATYSTLTACIAAMAAATGSVSGERFDTKAVPSNGGGGKILLTMVTLGGAANGNTIQLGGNDVAAGLGFSGNPDTLAGGAGGDPGASVGSARIYVETCTPVSF